MQDFTRDIEEMLRSFRKFNEENLTVKDCIFNLVYYIQDEMRDRMLNAEEKPNSFIHYYNSFVRFNKGHFKSNTLALCKEHFIDEARGACYGRINRELATVRECQPFSEYAVDKLITQLREFFETFEVDERFKSTLKGNWDTRLFEVVYYESTSFYVRINPHYRDYLKILFDYFFDNAYERVEKMFGEKTIAEYMDEEKGVE